MTIEKKNPNATTVAAASNAIAAINDRDNRLETAAFGHSTVALGGGTTKTLTSAEFWDGHVLVLTGTPSGAFTLTVPANKRGPFRVRNDSTQTVTIGISGQPLTKPTVAAGETADFDCDGVNVLAGGSSVTTGSIADNAVTNAKLADMATARIKGRVTGSTGDPEDLTGTQATTLLDVFTTSLKGLTPSSGGGTTNYLRADGTWDAPPGAGGGLSAIKSAVWPLSTQIVLSRVTALPGSPTNGDIYIVPSGGDANKIAIRESGAWVYIVPTEGWRVYALDVSKFYRFNGSSWVDGDIAITLTGDAATTGTIYPDAGTGTITVTIGNDAISNAKMANMATSTFKGRSTAGTGDPEDLSVSSAKTLLGLTGTNSGDQTITLTGDVTGSGTGSFAASIASNAVVTAKIADANVTNAKLATVAQAIGKQTIWVPASAMTPATTNGPAAGQIETTTNKVNISVLDFDATTAEQAWFNISFPKGWNEGTVTFRAKWTTAATGTTGIGISLAGVSLSDNDALDTAVGTAVVIQDDAQSGALEQLITAESSAVTIAGTPAADDLCFFRVQRVVSDGNDDMTEDMRLIGIEVFYTTDAANDA